MESELSLANCIPLQCFSKYRCMLQNGGLRLSKPSSRGQEPRSSPLHLMSLEMPLSLQTSLTHTSVPILARLTWTVTFTLL